MSKYYVTVRAEVQVILEEVYLVHASNPEEAEGLVTAGHGDCIEEEILEYGETLNEYIYSVKTNES